MELGGHLYGKTVYVIYKHLTESLPRPVPEFVLSDEAKWKAALTIAESEKTDHWIMDFSTSAWGGQPVEIHVLDCTGKPSTTLMLSYHDALRPHLVDWLREQGQL